MTKKERFMTALRLGVPDVVPVAPLIHHRFAHKVLGRWDWRAVFEVHQMLGSIHFRGPLSVGVHSSLPEGYSEDMLKRSSHRLLKCTVSAMPNFSVGQEPDPPKETKSTPPSSKPLPCCLHSLRR
jgi:hypothetical protein